MNSRKKRFWKQWNDKNRELAEVDVNKANSVREIKFLGFELI